ncbi:MAG: hypothetical protein P8K77_08915 [Polaribacter sp.]|nr:hypothetical protein [Polaribacter sp.]
MKELLLIVCIFSMTTGFTQTETKPIISYTSKAAVTSLKLSIDGSNDLKTINWNDIKEIFKDNNDDQLIQLELEIDLPKSKNKIQGSFKMQGERKNIDRLLLRAKKGIKGLLKVINNNKN